MIHPTAIISPKAELGRNVRVGPYCIIGPNVTLGDECVLHSHVVIEGTSTFGKGNEFFPFAVVGGKTQDLKYIGEPTALEVGNENVFRENCTIHRGTHSELPTRIGSHNLFLCYSHVAHDCQLGTYIILDHITRAARAGLGYVYLGYWVEGSDRMAYKATFKPMERLGRDGWRRMDAPEPAPVADRPLPVRSPRRILIDA